MVKEMEKNPNSGKLILLKIILKYVNELFKAGPVINIYREYKKMNKLNLLKNATGLSGINFERNTQIFSDSYAVHESLLCVSLDNYLKF